MTTLEALQNRERCLAYLEGCKARANPECLEAVRLSVVALREKLERENPRKPYTPPTAEILPELAPCPDCGGKVSLLPSLRFKGYYVIFCPNCCIQTDGWDNIAALCEAWNKAHEKRKE